MLLKDGKSGSGKETEFNGRVSDSQMNLTNGKACI